MKKPSRKMRNDFPALGMSDQDIRSSSNTTAERLEALHEPRTMIAREDGAKVLRRVRDLSPLAHAHPTISAGIDKAREHGLPQAFPPSVEQFGEDTVWAWEHSDDPQRRLLAEAIRLGVETRGVVSLSEDEYPVRVLLNTGRPPQPQLPGGKEYSVADLLGHEQRRQYYEGPHIVAEVADADELWRLDYERIVRGGVPDQTVVVHSSRDDMDTAVYPVPVQCSQRRALWLLWQDPRVMTVYEPYRECWFCEDWLDDGIDSFLTVSCGATLRALPTCPSCRRQFLDDTNAEGLDFFYPYDRSFFEQGCPDDAYLPA
jgi:hypothetical protein